MVRVIIRMISEFILTCFIYLAGIFKAITLLIRHAAHGIHLVANWIDTHPDKVISSLSTVDDKIHKWAFGDKKNQ